MSEQGTEDRAAAALRYIRGTLEDLDAGRGTAQGALWEILITARSGLPAGQVPPKAPAKFDEAAFDAAVSKPNGWSKIADPVAEIRRMRGDTPPTSPATPEPLAAILADYRADIPAMTSGELPHPTPEYLRILLDRIEAAAKQEAIDAELKWTRIGYDERKAEEKRAPGNAAAMRDALERIVGWCEGCHADACEKVCRPELTSESIHAALAALSAPARNCDRFATAEEARDAAKEEFANTMLLDDRQLRAVCDWLLDKAEGGEK